jgi:hypothetical protein
MVKHPSTPTRDGAMAPICEAIDAVLRGLTIRIGNSVIKSVEIASYSDGICTSKAKYLKELDIDDLLNGIYSPSHFDGWSSLIETGIKEFSIIDMKKFKNLKAPNCEEPDSDGD